MLLVEKAHELAPTHNHWTIVEEKRPLVLKLWFKIIIQSSHSSRELQKRTNSWLNDWWLPNVYLSDSGIACSHRFSTHIRTTYSIRTQIPRHLVLCTWRRGLCSNNTPSSYHCPRSFPTHISIFFPRQSCQRNCRSVLAAAALCPGDLLTNYRHSLQFWCHESSTRLSCQLAPAHTSCI